MATFEIDLKVGQCNRMSLAQAIEHDMQVVCDGEPLELPDDIEGVLILNINSYMGGVDLWASGFNSTVSMKTGKQSLCDGMLEVGWHYMYMLPCVSVYRCNTPSVVHVLVWQLVVC